MEFLRDPIWQFIGIIIGTVTAIIGIWISIRLANTQQTRKSFYYEIITSGSLFNDQAWDSQGKLEIAYDGQSVSNLNILVLRLVNSGNTPILASDYERSIEFRIGTWTRVLDVSVSEADPPGLRVVVTFENNKFEIEPLLLNPGDSVTLRVLFSGMEEGIFVDGRIAGVKQIEKRERVEREAIRAETEKRFNSSMNRITFFLYFGLAILIVASLIIAFIQGLLR